MKSNSKTPSKSQSKTPSKSNSQTSLKPKSKIKIPILIGVVIILAFLGIQYYWLVPGVSLRSFKMTGFTMHPALQDGDCVFVSQLFYLKHQPRRGDLVLLKSPENPNYWYIRRIVALGGEQLQIKGTHVIINGKEIRKSWNIYIDQGEPKGLDNLPIYQVPKDAVFVLGDNADFSIDSRSFGAIPKRDLKGKVMWVYWSAALNKIGRAL